MSYYFIYPYIHNIIELFQYLILGIKDVNPRFVLLWVILNWFDRFYSLLGVILNFRNIAFVLNNGDMDDLKLWPINLEAGESVTIELNDDSLLIILVEVYHTAVHVHNAWVVNRWNLEEFAVVLYNLLYVFYLLALIIQSLALCLV